MVVDKSEEKIYSYSYISMIAVMIISSFFGLTSYLVYESVGQNAFITGVVGMILGFIVLGMFVVLKKNMGDMDIIDYNIMLFGKFFGNIINIIINVSIFLIATFFLQNINNFISTDYLTETSHIYIKVLILAIVAFAASKKVSVISKVSNVIFLIYIVFYIVSIIGIFDKTDFTRLLPISHMDSTLVNSAFTYIICGLFSIFLLTIIPGIKLYEDKSQTKKIFFIYVIANLAEVGIMILTVSLLGEDLIKVYKFSEYIALQEFSIFSIIERFENTMALQFVINIFITMTVMVYFIYTSISKAFKNVDNKSYFDKYSSIVTSLICFALLIFSEKVYTSFTLFSIYIKEYYMLLILLGFIVPMFISFLAGIINKKLIKSTQV